MNPFGPLLDAFGLLPLVCNQDSMLRVRVSNQLPFFFPSFPSVLAEPDAVPDECAFFPLIASAKCMTSMSLAINAACLSLPLAAAQALTLQCRGSTKTQRFTK